ncbi:MAG: polyphosphate kinase 2 [Campylobacteraceae bacterium]|jgi:polyphosphate kinase 2|nr:polyphosphate kinase 2 [Campylobacteraceae bacterium]MBT5323174.1 polyphosphate kinase 2 [Campylobacteraceae bacterium]MBT5983297.1 polyphosphate kinase 2 [Campylobacteraceae bacterium]MBT6108162.1 polyphosphate kinase 2 [Campylobacteraceae bacterium]MBT6577299.1 polyphosphate kinase 2 [Campylobacteraceae bacterium]
MNLSDYQGTKFRGLFISKEAHETFGNKYVARFQLNKKRYVKVLGYENVDNLNDDTAYEMLLKYKDSLLNKSKVAIKLKKQDKKDTKNITKDVSNDEELMRELLGDFKDIDPAVLKEGIEKVYHKEEMKQYQIELIKLQKYLEKTNKKVIVLFEGRDASGKGGAIRRITRYMNSRHYRVVALGKPSETQQSQWFFQRYIEHFPTGGEVLLFDRSWYNRAMVEPIFGFCTEEQHEIFMEDVVNFEHDLVRQDITLVKLYFSVSKAEQFRRFERRRIDQLRQWKLSEVDLQAQDLWDEFSEKKYEMLKRTHTRSAPWHILRSDDKHKARLEAIKVILNSVDYDNRNYALNFEADSNYNISVQKELRSMRKDKDY